MQSESLPFKGYDLLDAENPFGGPVFYRRRTETTMEDATSLLRSGAPYGTVVVADYQSAGRGQGPDRRWAAEAGSSLMFTLILSEAAVPFPKESLPLRTALGLVRYLLGAGLSDVEVKWPNDVLVAGRKISGVLCHRGSEVFFVGVGLNLNQRRFPPDLRHPATSVGLARGDDSGIVPTACLSPLLHEVHGALAAATWRGSIEGRLWKRGRRICVPGSGEAVLLGLAESGALRVKSTSSGEIRELFSAESVLWTP